jgi:hypothetical protein
MPFTHRNLMALLLAPVPAGTPGMLVDLGAICIATLFLAVAILIGRVYSNRPPGNSRACIRVRT